MVLNVSQISGIGDFTKKSEKERDLYLKDDRVFLVINKNTIEIRSDAQLMPVLKSKYESVMESRYFGRGGLEIVLAGQLSEQEIDDLIRLSYNLS